MRPTLSYFAAFIALGVVTASLGPTLPALAARVGVGYDRISLLFVARAVGVMVGAFIFGLVYDRWRGQATLAAALLALAALMALAPFPSGLGVMLVVFVMIGIADGGVDVGGNTLTVWAHPGRPGPVLNALHTSFGIGGFLAPLIVAEIGLRSGSIVTTYLAIGAIVAVPSLLVALAPSPRPKSKETGRGGVETATGGWILLLSAFLFLFVGAEASSSGWIFSYARGRGMEEVQAAYATSVFWAAFTLSRFICIALAWRWSPSRLLAGSLIGGLLSLVVLLAGGGNRASIWVGVAGLGAFLAPVFPMTVALAGQSMRLTGRVTGWFLVGGALGAMFLPWVIGQFFETAGPVAVIVILLIDLVFASVLGAAAIAGNRRRRGWRENAEHAE